VTGWEGGHLGREHAEQGVEREGEVCERLLAERRERLLALEDGGGGQELVE